MLLVYIGCLLLSRIVNVVDSIEEKMGKVDVGRVVEEGWSMFFYEGYGYVIGGSIFILWFFKISCMGKVVFDMFWGCWWW